MAYIQGNQNPDYEDLLKNYNETSGDLCFLQLWERYPKQNEAKKVSRSFMHLNSAWKSFFALILPFLFIAGKSTVLWATIVCQWWQLRIPTVTMRLISSSFLSLPGWYVWVISAVRKKKCLHMPLSVLFWVGLYLPVFFFIPKQAGCDWVLENVLPHRDIDRFQQQKCNLLFWEATQMAKHSHVATANQDLFLEEGSLKCWYFERQETLDLTKSNCEWWTQDVLACEMPSSTEGEQR